MKQAATHDTEAIGWIGPGDQGPADGPGDRRGRLAPSRVGPPSRLRRALGSVEHKIADSIEELAGSCDIVALCVSTDDDVGQLVAACPERAACPP